MNKEQLERICFNCNYFFPSREEATEFGICLEDKDFEPYIDELLENMNFSCCRELIQEKEFPGDKDACNQFEEAVIIEIDDEDYQTDTETGSDFLDEEDIWMDHTDDRWRAYYREMDEDEKFDFIKNALESKVTSDSDLDPGLGEAVIDLLGNLLKRKRQPGPVL